MNIIKRQKEGVTFFTFPILEKENIVHGFSTKLGGVSKGDCATMNLSFHRGDNPDDVLENHKRFAKAVGYQEKNLVFTDQIHETTVQVVTANDCGKGIMKETDIIGVDGLITNDPEVVLMTFFADCVPLFFYDKKNHAIGASHSGWRGTVKRMGAVTLQRMQEEFGTSPKDVIAVVGPSICQDCYEVSEEVAVAFREEFDKKYWNELMYEMKPGKYQLDLWCANEIILEEAGVPKEQIQVSGLCTCCHKELLFSHRATMGKRGNLAGVITLGGNA